MRTSFFWPRGLVTSTLQGASGFPVVDVMTVTGLGSPTLIAVKWSGGTTLNGLLSFGIVFKYN